LLSTIPSSFISKVFICVWKLDFKIQINYILRVGRKKNQQFVKENQNEEV